MAGVAVAARIAVVGGSALVGGQERVPSLEPVTPPEQPDARILADVRRRLIPLLDSLPESYAGDPAGGGSQESSVKNSQTRMASAETTRPCAGTVLAKPWVTAPKPAVARTAAAPAPASALHTLRALRRRPDRRARSWVRPADRSQRIRCPRPRPGWLPRAAW